MTPPVVGLTTYREPARWGVWQTTADLLPTEYTDMVCAAGGVPVLLPPAAPRLLQADRCTSRDIEQLGAVADAAIAALDALVICGGADIDPARYEQRPHPATDPPRHDRDLWEFALIAAADRVALPTLGICRGMQALAVAAGGSLEQHLPDQLAGSTSHSPGNDQFGEMHIRVETGSLLATVIGNQATGRCHHHQSVRDHPGFTPVAYSGDGVLEAMERPGNRFCLAVQWHPEAGADRRLFEALLDATGR